MGTLRDYSFASLFRDRSRELVRIIAPLDLLRATVLRSGRQDYADTIDAHLFFLRDILEQAVGEDEASRLIMEAKTEYSQWVRDMANDVESIDVIAEAERILRGEQ